MKKQLLIAAVAASMTSAAMADISITGGAFIKWEGNDSSVATTATTTNSAVGFDIDVAGKTGDTAAYAHLDIDDAATTSTDTSPAGGKINVDELWVETKIGDVKVKAGDFSSGTGMIEGIDKAVTASNAISLSTTVAGISVGVSKDMDGTATTDDNAKVTISGDLAGHKWQIQEKADTFTDIAVTGAIAAGTGSGYYIEHINRDAADSDSTLVAAHTSIGGVKVSVASLDADESAANTGDLRVLGSSLVGDYHTAAYTTNASMTDVKAIGFNTDVAGNNVNLVFINADTNNSVVGDDNDLWDIVVQRKLASGATLDLSYGVADQNGKTSSDANVDTTNYGAQVTVKF